MKFIIRPITPWVIRSSLNRPIVLIFLSVSLMGISEEGPKPKDPFSRNQSGEKGDPVESETNVVIGVQLARVPSSDIRQWDEEGLRGNDLRDQVERLIKAGSAEIVDSVAGNLRSGVRGKFQSIFELRSPTSFVPINDSEGAPLYPLGFETRNLGIYLEVDPMLNAEQDLLSLNFAFEWSRYLGEKGDSRVVTERTKATDILYPNYSVQRVNRQITLPIGDYRVLTRMQPVDPKNNEGFEVIVFGRADLVVVSPVLDRDSIEKAGKELDFRASWVEVDARVWHDAIHANSLSSWFGEKAWDRVRAWEEQGVATFLATSKVGSISGQRARLDLGEVMQYRTSFPPPGTSVEDARSTTKWRSLGHILEFDPVLGANGIIFFNLNAVSTSMHGWGVSFRRKEKEEWVPEVQFPRFYASSVVSNVMLGEASDLLVGVGNPPLENGHPDTSRKWLLFIHNDTYPRE